MRAKQNPARLALIVSLIVLPVLLASAASSLPGQGTPMAADSGGGAIDGKAVFLGARCNMCHAIASHDIEATTKSEKMKGPDLSDVGSHHQADWMKRFLKKEEELEGKKHGREFQGTDEELAALVSWLASLREE